jgi:AcrR family transcriptional regulator
MPPTGSSSPVRDRLLEAATELFYSQGLRAVSVDKVIERASTTKVTFYRHFKSKDDLVVDYLEHAAALERASIDASVAHGDGDVDAVLRLMSEQLGGMACSPGFRGCAFINAAAEYPDLDSPVRRVIDAHRAWYKATFRLLVAPLGLPDPAGVADDLMLLRDGAMVSGYLDRSQAVADSFLRSSQAVVGRDTVSAR